MFDDVGNIVIIELNTTQHHGSIKLTTLIPSVIQTGAIGILIEVVGSFAVDMTTTFFQRRFHFPDAVQLPALTFWIQM